MNIPHGQLEKIIAAVAQHLQHARIGIDKTTRFHINDVDAVLRGFEQPVQQRFALRQALGQHAAFADIAPDAVQGIALIKGDRREGDLGKKGLAIGAPVHPFETIHALLAGNRHHALGLAEGILAIRLPGWRKGRWVQVLQHRSTAETQLFHGSPIAHRKVVAVDDPGGVRRQVEQVVQLLLTPAHPCFTLPQTRYQCPQKRPQQQAH